MPRSTPAPRRPRARAAAVALALAAAPALALAGPAGPARADVEVIVKTLHFKVTTGASNRLCDVVGDLYVPADATAANPAPAILTTNGFGGSKDDQKPTAVAMSQHHYVVLSYSGLGFGGSGCPITDDDPDTDGQAARQLVSYLGGATGIAYTDFNAAAGWTGAVPALDVVKRDATAHDGTTQANDPRVGMIGGSYGGQIQFAAAGVDPRIDTIVPLITWNELTYSLTPGNGGVTTDSLQAGLPGVAKREWDSFFFGLGVTAFPRQKLGEPLAERSAHPEDASCPGFLPITCMAQVGAVATGYGDPAAQAFFHHSSVAAYLDRIRVPVLLGQGEADTLFNLQEAAANYASLKARGIPVKMMWQSWGHSRIGPAAGEYVNPLNPGDATPVLSTYQGQIFEAWFDHYLGDSGPAPALDFSYFRDWALTGSGRDAVAAAYATAPSYPLPGTERLLLSGSGSLVPTGSAVLPGAASLTTPPAGAPASYSETSAIGIAGSYGSEVPQPPPSDPAGTAATWTSAPLAADTDVVGSPTLDVTVSAPDVASQQTADPTTHLLLFAKLYDVGPDGALLLPERLVSPVRVADVRAPLHVTLPGIVHRFAQGHQLRLVVAGSDSAYSPNSAPRAVSFPTSAAAPGVLTVPVTSAPASTSDRSAAPAPAKRAAPAKKKAVRASATRRPAAKAAAARPVQPTRALAFTGLTSALPVAGAALLGGALVLRRRRRTA